MNALPPVPARIRYIVAPAPHADRTCESCERRDAVQVVAFGDSDAAFYVCDRCRP